MARVSRVIAHGVSAEDARGIMRFRQGLSSTLIERDVLGMFGGGELWVSANSR